ncbi:MAG: transcriptional repressor [Clostridiales bacterium]|nr:transcriptional repressor [Clostridiales bacterium]
MERAVRYSKKRTAVYDVLCSTKSHPTAEWIYTQVKREFPDISLGTVYRNLAMFKADGKVVCVGVVDGQERYDATTSPHSHFVCRLCSSVLDVEEDAAAGDTPGVSGCGKIESREIIYRGVCSRCIEAGNC